MVCKRTLTLSEEERQALIDYRDHDAHPQVRERCAALLKIAAGQSAYQVSQSGLLKARDPDTVYQWLDFYEHEGLTGLIGRLHGGVRSGFPNERQAEVEAGLRQAPTREAPQSGGTTSRWTLVQIREHFAWLHDYSLSGIWRVLQRLKIGLRLGRPQQFSPDPAYTTKEAALIDCLHQAAREPTRVVVLFMDEMGFWRWPQAGWEWMAQAPTPVLTVPCAANNRQWRVIGVLNALTGQVNYVDNYIVGRQAVMKMYQQIDRIYPTAERIYVVQDNWSIHQHPDVQAALARFPRIQPVWLPTYAHWLNPIEKLWRWLRQAVLRLHRWADAWPILLQRVRDFLNQFAHGSLALLRYVGLLGEGRLARAARSP